ncbi:MAG: hypothetical protein K2O11_12610, partial [Oscillospiraceae bacterium]|nr:hypothetical protein [Oscillospiraceae bacterium]
MAVMLVEWVFTSVFLILVVLALRAALRKRVSARLRYALWAVVLVRLLVPVQLFTSPIAGTVVLLGSDPDQGIYTAPNPPAAPDNVLSLGGQDGPSVTLSNFPQAPNPPTLPDAPEPPAAPDLTKAPIWLGCCRVYT